MNKLNGKLAFVVVFVAGVILGAVCQDGLLPRASAQISAGPSDGGWSMMMLEKDDSGERIACISPNGHLQVVKIMKVDLQGGVMASAKSLHSVRLID